MEAVADLDGRFEELARIGSLGPPEPHAFFGALRAQGPVVPSPLGDGGVLARSYDAVSRVFRDAQLYSSAGYAGVVGKLFGHSILVPARAHALPRARPAGVHPPLAGSLARGAGGAVRPPPRRRAGGPAALALPVVC